MYSALNNLLPSNLLYFLQYVSWGWFLSSSTLMYSKLCIKDNFAVARKCLHLFFALLFIFPRYRMCAKIMRNVSLHNTKVIIVDVCLTSFSFNQCWQLQSRNKMLIMYIYIYMTLKSLLDVCVLWCYIISQMINNFDMRQNIDSSDCHKMQ